MKFHQLKVFGKSPLLFVQVGVYIVVPPLPALLSDPSGQEGSDLFPLFKTVLSDLLLENHVLFGGPVAFDLLDSAIFSLVPQLEPTVHTIHRCSEGHLKLFLLYLLVQDLADDLDVLYFMLFD